MRRFTKHILGLICAIAWAGTVFAQPPNDNCANASMITIPNNGWGYGSVTSDTVDLTNATLEFGEYVHPAQVAQDKSVWYRFSIPTTRNARIILRQTGPPFSMAATDAGWTLFRDSACPADSINSVDPPILNIEGYTHECLKAGDYLLQVTGTFTAAGQIYVEIQTSPSTANEIDYDYAAAPYNFGVVTGVAPLPARQDHFYEVGCQSISELEVPCPDSTFTKSTWHVFTTDNVVDYVRFEISESPWNPFNLNPRVWGYNLYEGDCITDSIPDDGPGLNTVDTCKILTVNNNTQYANCWNFCELKPNTTYSIQLFHETDYSGMVNVRLYETGVQNTLSPDPLNIPPAFQMGSLPFGSTTIRNDYFSCNSLMEDYPCAPVNQDTVTVNGVDYDMAIWMTFEVPVDAHVDLRLNNIVCQYNPLVRIFSGDVSTAGCGGLALDTTFTNRLYYRCMPAGQYSVQILGRNNPDQGHTCYTNMSKPVQFWVNMDQVAPQLYGLHTPGEIDTVNNGNAPVSGQRYYGNNDYLDCRTTVLPAGDSCQTGQWPHDRAIYRKIWVDEDGVLSVGGGVWYRFRYRLFRGDASALPIVGNRIQGLVDQVGCQSLYYPAKVCVTQGWYTLVTYGDVQEVTFGDRPWFQFDTIPPTQFTDPNNPEVMDTLGMANGNIDATGTQFTCLDNPLTILGNTPCAGATKQIYREFYLDSPQLVTFTPTYNWLVSSASAGTIQHRFFEGRLSTNSLTGMYRNCGGGFTACMQPGWYTVVTYGTGNTFSSAPYNTGRGGSIGDLTDFGLTINPNLQQYGTFATAEQVNGGTPITWGPNGGHTPAIPKNDRNYTLGTEYWVCADNLPFPAGITPCLPAHNRVSYRVFTLTQSSNLMIEGINPWPYGHQSRLYFGDITTQSPPFSVAHECITDDMRLCAGPGTYTLVTFASDAHIGRTMTPTIYLDSAGTSRFDHAQNAYDFGLVPNDGNQYLGNPLDPPQPFGRAGSNDFFFCTTGAQASDPRNVCPIGQDPPPPALPSPWNPRRTLWYTFTVSGPGQVDVSVYNLTPGKPTRSPFAIYRGNNAVIPPADSTVAQGLTLINRSTTYYCGNYQTINFVRDACVGLDTVRYYILVDQWSNTGNNSEPNTQIEVGVRFTPAPPSFVLYDHYSQANVINADPTLQCNAPYQNDTLYSGTFTGCVGNLNCATQDPPDQNTCGDKTIWYTFTVSGSGQLRLNYDRPDSSTHYDPNDIQLYKSVVPGDSTIGGLVRVPLTAVLRADNPDFEFGTNNWWGEGCMEPGQYYIMFTGCNYPTETVIPRIWLLPELGDLCHEPLVINVDSAGTFSARANVGCFTIGEAPGEDGSNLGCLGTSPVGLKSAWFRVELDDTTSDKWDLDIEIDEYTNVTGDLIRYRIANGDCDAMTFDNCVEDGIFIILNMKCRPLGPFWVQVTMPDYASDSIVLNVTATPAPDTACLPIEPDRPRANFDYTSTCVDVPVSFLNSSTTGPNVSYTWDFGNGFGSTVMHPVHQFAVPDTYFVSLIVDNGILIDTIIRPVIVYPRPATNFSVTPGNPPYFVGDSIALTNLTTNTVNNPIYFWDFCAGNPPCGASISSYVGPNPPRVSYSTPGWKMICLTVINGLCDSVYCDSLFISDTTIWAGGPYDGFDNVRGGDSCLTNEMNVFAGGPYDGHSTQYLTDTCTNFIPNVFVGGPYDGADYAYLTDSCSTLLINVFAGGPYDGHDDAFLTDGCSNLLINVFAGGPYDGHSHGSLTEICAGGLNNIFAGGPYDGHDVAAIIEVCNTGSNGIFAGGPYDGASSEALILVCPSLAPNIYAGGPYDGHDVITMICDTLVQDSTDSVYCDTCFFAGGPYDGAAVAALYECIVTEQNVFAGGPYDGHAHDFITDSCDAASNNIFAGGPYDGHDYAYLTDSCSSFVINLFAGGPYDGHDNAYYTDSCSSFLINIFAGGPYDGHADEYYTDSCSSFLVNVFAGGPYDGHDYAFLTDSCSDFVINLFAGGPYDGHGFEHLILNDSTPFDAVGDTICIGLAGTLVASSPSNWFVSNGVGGYQYVGGPVDTFLTPVFYTAGLHDFYVDDPFRCEKYLVQVMVLDTLANPDFVANPGCAPDDTTFFTNQSIVPGPSQPSIGGAWAPINLQGYAGSPPGATQLSFSSVQTANFSYLANGVQNQQYAWTANNTTGPSTEWVQWHYLTPKSVNQFHYWPRDNCCPDKGPTALRLYYDDGGGWVLVKTWNPTYPSNAVFDSGFFFETANIYARRWKLEADVLVPFAPSWGEFQVFASDPTVGGVAFWDFGDGNNSNDFDPIHQYASGGTYMVNLIMEQPGVLCVNNVIHPVFVDNCVPLPLIKSLLGGEYDSETESIHLQWDVEGHFDNAYFQKLADGSWVDLNSFPEDPNVNLYGFEDLQVLYGEPNLYRVKAIDYGGQEHVSNTIDIRVETAMHPEVVLYPNPLERGDANLLLKLPSDVEVEVEVFDLFGRNMGGIDRQTFAKGVSRTSFDASHLSLGTYIVVIRVGKDVFTRKLVVL